MSTQLPLGNEEEEDDDEELSLMIPRDSSSRFELFSIVDSLKLFGYFLWGWRMETIYGEMEGGL